MPTLKVVTTIDIEANAERVWDVLTDFSAYPEWNPFIVRAKGVAAAGTTVVLRIRSTTGWSATNRARVLAAVPVQVLRWTARLIPVPGLAAGTHQFELTSTDTGTHLVQSEVFSGLLVPLMRRMLARTEHDFRLLNEALKKQSENG